MALTPKDLQKVKYEVRAEFARSLRRRTRRLTAGFAALAVGLVFAVADSHHNFNESLHATVHSGRAVAVAGCNDRFVDREKFRSLLLRLRHSSDASYRNHVIPKSQYVVAIKFYNEQLRNFPTIDCRIAERITADPASTEIKEPAPFYPNGPNNPKVDP
jgi:hypothetical protein